VVWKWSFLFMYIIVSRGSYFLQFLKSRRFLRVRFGMMIWSQMRFFREFRHSINSGLVSFNITSFFNVLKSCVEVINFLLFHSLSPFTLQTIFIATSSFALQSHEILGLILELFLWKLMAVSRPIHSGLTISFTRNISLCLLRFFQVFVINTGFF